MASLRKYLLLSALVMLGLTVTPAVRADDILTGLNVSTANGLAIGTLVYADVLGVQQWVYTDTETDVFNTRNTEFTATFADVLGIETLTVTDTCVQVNIFGPGIPCQELAFAFEDLSLGDANLVSAFGDASTLIDGQIAEIAFGASVGSSGATFDYDPPAPPAVGATPEPGSLALAATGLLGVAGMVRRKMRPSADIE